MIKIKCLTKIFVLSLTLSFVCVAQAGNKNPWTDCGIGAMIFSETPAGAAISNVIWDLGTTAVTSAGVSEETCEGDKEAVAARFVYEAYASLEEETAKGDGEHVRAMLSMMGCESTSHEGIIGSIRGDFRKVMSEPDYVTKTALAKSEGYYNIVTATVGKQYSQQCQAL